MARRICPLCGRETGVVVGGMCPQCYADRFGIVVLPDRVSFDICRYCGSIRLGNRWVQVSSFDEAIDAAINYIISKRMKNTIFNNIKIKIIKYETKPNWTTRANIIIIGEYNGAMATQNANITIHLKPTICPLCKTRISGEYDTLLQIRGEIPHDVEDTIMREIQKMKLERQLVDIIESKKGLDVYFTNLGAARKIAKRLSKLYKGRIEGVEYEDVTISRTGLHRTRKTLRLRLEKQDQ